MAAPALALALLVIFGILGFGWRSWAQRRRTGSTGFRGVSGRPGSVEWCAGAGFVVAIAAATAAPALQFAGLLSPVSLLDAAWIRIVGAAVAVSGIVATLCAQVAMGDSWRIGVDPQETTTLVRSGVFGWVRNPIFAAMLLFGLGIALLTPNALALTAFALLLASIEAQVRAVEEPYLRAVHGDRYREYTATVGRFVPGVGLRG